MSTKTKTSSKAAGKKAAHAGQAEPEAGIPMGKLLASTEKKTRDSAIRSLALFLAKSNEGDSLLPPLELAKLWKGIFYCFWMSDKPLVQQALAQELSDLLLAIPGTSRMPAPSIGAFAKATRKGAAPASEQAQTAEVGPDMSARARGGLSLLEGFWDEMAREWSGLDKWRIDKFYLLLRRFVNAAFRLLARDSWDEGAILHFSRLMVKEGGPLCANDVKVPDGLTYHLTDVYLEELEKALAWAEENAEEDAEDAEAAAAQLESSSSKKKKRPANGDTAASVSQNKAKASLPVKQLLQPMVDTAATCHSNTVYEKILSNVLQPLLDDCLVASAIAPEKSERASKRRRGEEASSSDDDDDDDDEDEEDEDDDDDELTFPRIIAACGMTPLALRAQVYAMIFEAASKDSSVPARRRRLYAMWKEERERKENAGEEDEDEE